MRGEIVGMLADRASASRSGAGALPRQPGRLSRRAADRGGEPRRAGAAVLRHPHRSAPIHACSSSRSPSASCCAARRGRRAAALGRRYVASLEARCRAHPFNWFNFYPFWGDAVTLRRRTPAARPPPVAAGVRARPPPRPATWLDELMRRLAAIPARQRELHRGEADRRARPAARQPRAADLRPARPSREDHHRSAARDADRRWRPAQHRSRRPAAAGVRRSASAARDRRAGGQRARRAGGRPAGAASASTASRRGAA